MTLFLAVLACTTLGFFNAAPVWSVATATVIMTVLGAHEDRAIATRFSRHGGTRILSLALTQSVASNLVFAAASFMTGRAIAWLMHGFL